MKYRLLQATLFVLLSTFIVSAQTLRADYQFQGNLNSSVAGAPAMTNLTGSGGANSFQSDTVDGTARQSLRFPFNSGVSVGTSGLIPNNAYTIVMLFRFDAVSGFRRVVGFDNGTTDNGAYIQDGRLEFENTANPPFLPNTYIQVVVVREASGRVRAYRDGILRVDVPNDGGTFQIVANALRFFQDDVLAPTEASAGNVARIRLYDAPMTTAQVGLLDRVPVIARRTPFDFDGDAKADVSVFRPSAATWFLNRSTAGFAATNFGLANDKLTPADYDGDGKTDISVFRSGIWYRLNSFDGAFSAVSFGLADDVPVPADYDGDGRADQAVYRNGIWYLNRSTAGFAAVSFGIATDKTVAGDYDGDDKADVAVYRNGIWYYLRSLDGGFVAVSFGIAADKPVPADYDGDGKTDQAVYRNGVWFMNRSTAGFAAVSFGIASDVPVPADYDGDGKADQAVFRDGIWYQIQSTAGFAAQSFGLTTDKPIPAALLP